MSSCQLHGCNKPTSGTRLACGEHHHFLLMDSRYSSFHSKQPLVLQKPPHLCTFSRCSNPPSPGYTCCSKSHYLSWLQNAYASLRPDQICRLPDCNRHVFVEVHSNGSMEVYEFCGWKHCQQFYIRNALRSFGEKCMGHEPSVESRMDSLKDYVRDKNNRTTNTEVDEGFFKKHPWEVLNRRGMVSCWRIVRCIWNEKNGSKREWVTKDDWHWKQSSKTPRHSKDISKKYLTYEKTGRRKRGSNESNETFTMLEYTWVGAGNFKDYSLVKLCLGRDAQSKASKKARRSTDEADVVGTNNKQANVGNSEEEAVHSNDDQPAHNSPVEDVGNSDNDQPSIVKQAEEVVGSNHDQSLYNSPPEDVVETNDEQPYPGNSAEYSIHPIPKAQSHASKQARLNNENERTDNKQASVGNRVGEVVHSNHDQPIIGEAAAVASNDHQSVYNSSIEDVGEINCEQPRSGNPAEDAVDDQPVQCCPPIPQSGPWDISDVDRWSPIPEHEMPDNFEIEENNRWVETLFA